jgi:NAD(P)-dependent dehydrogenase (short-subunit alcohol dehydrogenase family)
MKILVTGASSGFGKLIVSELLKAGHTVVGTVRDPEGRNKEAADLLRDWGADIADIDVTKDASVEEGVATVSEKLGGIDVLVNNAGVGVHGLQENFSADDLQRVFDVNVFGPQRLMRAVLPEMRARGEGLILNVTSLLGRITLPFYGPYNATKWALEAMSENYRAELSQFGVDVAVVEPGGFPTEFHGNLIMPSLPDRNESYGEMAAVPEAARAQFNEFLAANPQQDPSLVADAIVSLVAAEPGTRPFRTEVDKVGMGDAVAPMNELAETTTHALFTNFGMADMLTLKTKADLAA